MMRALSEWRDRFLGREAASVTVPPLDGALKPNNLLEEAAHGLAVAEPDNLVLFGNIAVFSSGARLMRGDEVLQTLSSSITALAAAPDGTALAAACADGTLYLLDRALRPLPATSKPFACVTALSFADETTLLACEGSATYSAGEWQRDLLTQGRSGSLWRIETVTGDMRQIAANLRFPYGVVTDPLGGYVVAESWAKRLVRLDATGKVTAQVLEDLPGFPARLSPSGCGGYWLCVFAPRSQLIEFVLRETAYRDAMMAEVDPSFWIAPALKSNVSFFEPMQGGALKQMGILKPWAPTRSYGLIVELDARFQPLRSFHSRAGGQRHGITSTLELDGRLLLTSRGGDEVIALDLPNRTA
jgi:hypothetical protein